MFTMEPLTDPHDGDLYEQWPHIELNNVMNEPEPELWRSSNPGPSAPVTATPPQHNEMNTVATSTATATLGRFGDIAS